MIPKRVDYASLDEEYSDPKSLMYKKIHIVDSFIPNGGILLDIGSGTGELIYLRLGKHRKIYGIDNDIKSLEMCQQKFLQNDNVKIFSVSINQINERIQEKIDCITCLDILEHIQEKEIPLVLKNIHGLLNTQGIFIFSGPGVFEKLKISLGLSRTHLHSHSSYGWKKYIEDADFTIKTIESVEFPLIHSDFLRKNFHLFGKCCIIMAQKNE